MTYESVTAEMLQALSDEIDAVKNGGGGKQIPLQNGQQVGFTARRFLYTFALAFELVVPDDTPAQLRVGEQTYSVTVVTVDGFEITLAVQEDLGSRISAASLNTSPWYLLEILKTRLEEIVSGKLAANREMPMRLFNQAPNEPLPPCQLPEFDDVSRDGSTSIPNNKHAPNDEQKAAVLRSLSQKITFVWGPPGTGKTTTINFLVPALVRNGERVFITSHTNTAVDAVLKAAKNGLTEQEIRDGAIIRIGQLRERNADIEEITLDAVVERRGAEFRQQQASVESQLSAVRETENRWVWWERGLTGVAALEGVRDRANLDLEAMSSRGEEARLSVMSLSEEKCRLEARLVEAMNAGFFRRVFGGLNPERIRKTYLGNRLRFPDSQKR